MVKRRIFLCDLSILMIVKESILYEILLNTDVFVQSKPFIMCLNHGVQMHSRPLLCDLVND